jgi:hypothetical protein
MFDTFPKRVKEQYYPWIDNLLALPTNPNPPRFATKKQAFNLQESLERFAHLLGDPSVALRDPDTSDSFHALSDDKISTNAELIQTLETNQIYKFSIAGGGAPESWTGASFEEQNPERYGHILPDSCDNTHAEITFCFEPSRFSRRIQKTAGEGGTNMVEEIILAITESTAEEDLI